jgi:hypothetical protein
MRSALRKLDRDLAALESETDADEESPCEAA